MRKSIFNHPGVESDSKIVRAVEEGMDPLEAVRQARDGQLDREECAQQSLELADAIELFLARRSDGVKRRLTMDADEDAATLRVRDTLMDIAQDTLRSLVERSYNEGYSAGLFHNMVFPGAEESEAVELLGKVSEQLERLIDSNREVSAKLADERRVRKQLEGVLGEFNAKWLATPLKMGEPYIYEVPHDEERKLDEALFAAELLDDPDAQWELMGS